MNYAPIARIVIRYGVGVVVGTETAQFLAQDADVVSVLALGISLAVGVVTEFAYSLAVKKGWAT